MIKSTVLVTGATGNLGMALISKLLADYNVVGCARGNFEVEGKFKDNNLTFEKIDLASSKQVVELFSKYKFDQIVHLSAAMTRGNLNLEQAIEVFDSNVISTFNILSNIKTLDKLIFSSTLAVYGIPKHYPVNEKDYLRPLDFYSKSKVACEELIKDFSTIHRFKYIILRIPSIFSETIEEGAVYNFARNAIKGRDIVINIDKPVPWSAVYIDDVVNSILKSLSNDKLSNETITIGYDKGMELEQVAKKVVELLNSDSKIIKNYTFKNPIFYVDTRKLKTIVGLKLPSFDQRLIEYLNVLKS